nr:MAG TPA: hypothetical protein [Caudoviricetes sp.]
MSEISFYHASRDMPTLTRRHIHLFLFQCVEYDFNQLYLTSTC